MRSRSPSAWRSCRRSAGARPAAPPTSRRPRRPGRRRARVERLVGVVGADGVGDDLGLAEAARVVGADHGVRAVELVGQRLADVVHQRGAAGQLHVEPQLRGHHPAEERRLDGVLPLVLRVAGAVVEPADQPDDLGVRGAGSPGSRRPAAPAPPARRPAGWLISRAPRVDLRGVGGEARLAHAAAPGTAARPRAPRRRAPRGGSRRGARRATASRRRPPRWRAGSPRRGRSAASVAAPGTERNERSSRSVR